MKLRVPYSERVYEFACHSKACAPPPAGKGGSDKGDSGHASHQRDPDAMTENERLEKRRFQAGHAFETMKQPPDETVYTSKQRHNMLIQKIRTDHEAALAMSRAKRAAARYGVRI